LRIRGDRIRNRVLKQGAHTHEDFTPVGVLDRASIETRLTKPDQPFVSRKQTHDERVVFDMNAAGALQRIVAGERVGTLIDGDAG